MIKYIFSFILIIQLFFPGCRNEEEQKIIGVKIYKYSGSFGKLFEQWNRMGINTGFCSQELISDETFMKEARKHGISTFVIFPVFFNPDAIAISPELAAINRDGNQASEEWVEFVCPSREDYRQQVVEHARKIVRNHQPDGISIDFIRHFVYWEKVYPDRDPATLPVSCFDSVCIAHFQRDMQLAIPDTLITISGKADWILENHEDAWTRWRCRLITSMVEAITEAAREEKPDIMVNIHLVPWAEEDFQGAIKKVAGQDIRALSERSDYLSPMTYAHMVKQPPSWIHHIVEDVFMESGGEILPSIQVGKAYLETDFGLEEFSETVEAALLPPSSGVVLWSWERLMAEPEKAELFKDIVTAR
jgi:hypothetical protein